MKRPFVHAHLDIFVTDFGSRGQCSGCKSAYHKTAMISGGRYCHICISKKKLDISSLKFEKSDAKFHCPEECGVRNLSFEQFIVGTCCEKASRWIGTCVYFQNSFIHNAYAESREEEGKAEIKAETAAEKVKTCRKALEDAEKEEKDANDELNDKKKWRKKVQKRALHLAKAAMKEDNSDLESENEDKNNNNTDERKEQCSVCFEIYGEGNRQKSAIFPCGHQACYGCLTSLPQKICHTCRAEFTVDKILKLFSSGQN